MISREWKVGAGQSGMRLDLFLAGLELGLSRRKIRQVIDVGGVYINRKRIRVASRQVQRGDVIRVEYSEAALKQIRAKNQAFRREDLLYDADGVFALNKPPGMPAQATKDQSVMHVVPCLKALLDSLQQKRGPLILVHRLDKETSGVILVAEGNERATWLTELFRTREVEKTYLAIAFGRAKQAAFTEKAHLSEIDRRTGDVKAVHAGGRTAVTHFRVLAYNETLNVSLIECRPETGRSHQIRVHLELNGLPIVGDKRYGRGHRHDLPSELAELTALHHFLHAKALTFTPKAGAKPVMLTAEPPERFANFIKLAKLLQ